MCGRVPRSRLSIEVERKKERKKVRIARATTPPRKEKQNKTRRTKPRRVCFSCVSFFQLFLVCAALLLPPPLGRAVTKATARPGVSLPAGGGLLLIFSMSGTFICNKNLYVNVPRHTHGGCCCYCWCWLCSHFIMWRLRPRVFPRPSTYFFCPSLSIFCRLLSAAVCVFRLFFVSPPLHGHSPYFSCYLSSLFISANTHTPVERRRLFHSLSLSLSISCLFSLPYPRQSEGGSGKCPQSCLSYISPQSINQSINATKLSGRPKTLPQSQNPRLSACLSNITQPRIHNGLLVRTPSQPLSLLVSV